MRRDNFCETEMHIVIDAFQAKKTNKEIAAILCERGYPRTGNSVEYALRKLRLKRQPTNDGGAGWRQRQHIIDQTPSYAEQDERFRAAMLAAKSERVYVGVRKDFTPFAGRMIHPEPVYSCCGSSSAMCADRGAQVSNTITGIQAP